MYPRIGVQPYREMRCRQRPRLLARLGPAALERDHEAKPIAAPLATKLSKASTCNVIDDIFDAIAAAPLEQRGPD